MSDTCSNPQRAPAELKKILSRSLPPGRIRPATHDELQRALEVASPAATTLEDVLLTLLDEHHRDNNQLFDTNLVASARATHSRIAFNTPDVDRTAALEDMKVKAWLDDVPDDDDPYQLDAWRAHLEEPGRAALVPSPHALREKIAHHRTDLRPWHQECQAHRCAIASLDIGRQHWSVKLGIPHPVTGDLSIEEAVTSYGRLAGAPHIDAIATALALPLPSERPVDRRDLDKRKFERVITELERLGIKTVTGFFYGSSDEGALDSITAAPAARYQEVMDQPFDSSIDTFILNDDGTWSKHPSSENHSLADALFILFESWAMDSSVDWINNDGGNGTITIDVASRLVTREVYYCDSEGTLGEKTKLTFEHLAY